MSNNAPSGGNYLASDLTLEPLEFTAAAMEISRTSTQTTVACKFKMFQNTNADNAWEINIDWTAPTVTPTPGLMEKKDIEHRTLRLVSLHYACETSANPCTLKEFLRLKFKIMTKAN